MNASVHSIDRTPSSAFGLSIDRVGRPDPLFVALRRRIAGHYVVDPFGLDAQLCDLAAPVMSAAVRVEIDGAEHLPVSGPAVLVTNRGLGALEPAALAVAVQRTTGRRVRIIGAPSARGLGAALRRLGAIAASADDVRSALEAGHLVVVPMASGFGRGEEPPLDLVQTLMGTTVVPVAVRAKGPIGTGLAGWRVLVGAPIVADPSIPLGDPLGAAELSEHVRATIEMLT